MNPYLFIEESASVEWVCEREKVLDGISVRFLRYYSEDLNGFPLWMAGILAIPIRGAAAPGLIHLHGGAQCANEDIACAWARRGYVTFCPDWSVPAGTSGAPHATRWPQDILPIHQTQVEAGKASIGPIVRAVRRGISLLHRLPEVDANRIGMVGISWGGLMTWLVTGSDSRLRTAIAVFGSGLSAERELSPSWEKAFQPINAVTSRQAPILHLNGTHDFFGHLETSEALLKKAGPNARRLYVPNEDHGLHEAARHCAWAWLDLHLRGDGTSPPEPTWAPGPKKQIFHAPSDNRRAVWREVSADAPPDTGRFFVTESHTNGLMFSSAVHHGPAETDPGGPHLWSAHADRLEGLFLRWELENLQIHSPAKVRLIHTPHGVEAIPAQNRLCLYLRTDAVPPAQVTGLELICHAPRDSRIKLTLYTGPDIQDSSGFEAPEHRCAQHGAEKIFFPFSSFQPLTGNTQNLNPQNLHILRLELLGHKNSPADFCLSELRFGFNGLLNK